MHIAIEDLCLFPGRLVGDRNLHILGHLSQLSGQTCEQLSLRPVGRELAYQGTVFGIRAKLFKLFSQIFHARENAQKDNGVNVQRTLARIVQKIGAGTVERARRWQSWIAFILCWFAPASLSS